MHIICRFEGAWTEFWDELESFMSIYIYFYAFYATYATNNTNNTIYTYLYNIIILYIDI